MTANVEASGPIPLAKACRSEHAQTLLENILARRGQELSIDGSDVTFLGALNAQVLASARATWRLDDAPFEISAPSDELVNDLTLLGLETLLAPLDHSESTDQEAAK